MKPLLLSMALCVMLLVSCTVSYAQSGHGYEDSSILYPEQTVPVEEEETVPVEVPAEINYNKPVNGEEIDTAFVNNQHFLSPDSLWVIKNEKQFLYAKNLDSLLEELQKQQPPKEKEYTKSSGSYRHISDAPTKLENFFNSQVTQYFLWALAALFVLFVLYKLFFAEGIFRKSVIKNLVAIADEEESKAVTGRDFDAAIAKAKSERNFRLAVRYLYLQLLQRLSAKRAIEFAVDKTNTEYLMEITGKPYKEEVAALTMYYEYAWYGEFFVDENIYSKIENRYKNLVI